MKTVEVQVQRDHLERLTKAPSPLLALSEIIWNSLDADATEVKIELKENNLKVLDVIEVIDNGHGFLADEAEKVFGKLGGSWKYSSLTSKGEKRILHGKAGKGRFWAFTLAPYIEWVSTANVNGSLERCAVTASRDRVGAFKIGDPEPVRNQKTGTRVILSGISKGIPSLEKSETPQKLAEQFALYLSKYPQVRIDYNGTRIDAESLIATQKDYELEISLEHNEKINAELTVIEWKIQTERALLLCDENGFALREISPGIKAPGFNFTGYLKSNWIRELDNENLLDLHEMNPTLQRLLEAAKNKMRDYFRARQAESARSIVEEWKNQGIYPYEGNPLDLIEETERQIFDLCALNISEYLPDFNNTDLKNQQLSLKLLRQALEESPQSLQRILWDVLDLPEEKREELVQLLEKTTLSAIIEASKEVTNRLDFIAGLEKLVFDPVSKKTLLERSQLHRILAEETWIFGEQFNLTVDDMSLNEVLRKHLKLLGRDTEDTGSVLRPNGSEGIIDLMLSRLVPQPQEDEREHLIVELKKPSVPVDAKVAAQIESYAFAVADDERFKDTNTRWAFWAISNVVTTDVQRKTNQQDRPKGILYLGEDPKITIWVKTWGQIISECKGRLKFYQERLKYAADQDSALEYIRKTHGKYLPEVLKEQVN